MYFLLSGRPSLLIEQSTSANSNQSLFFGCCFLVVEPVKVVPFFSFFLLVFFSKFRKFNPPPPTLSGQTATKKLCFFPNSESNNVHFFECVQDLEIMAHKMDHGNIFRGLILRNEKASDNYNTDFLYRYIHRSFDLSIYPSI